MLPSENALIGPRTPVPLPSGRDAAAAHTRAGCPQPSAGPAGTPHTLFSFLYSTSPRTAVTLGGTVLADTKEMARAAAFAAIKAKYPDGVLKVIEVARNSRFPVKKQDGWISPSLLDGDIH